jgi:hypothetical protein
LISTLITSAPLELEELPEEEEDELEDEELEDELLLLLDDELLEELLELEPDELDDPPLDPVVTVTEETSMVVAVPPTRQPIAKPSNAAGINFVPVANAVWVKRLVPFVSAPEYKFASI